ncbi:MAG: helix-turn-helix transcriptional regulator [Pseudobdellovibrionaceae bacterium]
MTRISSTVKIENKIQESRNVKGLTQQELAEAVEVTRATVVALEKGSYNPSLELAFRLAKFFNKKIDDLFWVKLK